MSVPPWHTRRSILFGAAISAGALASSCAATTAGPAPGVEPLSDLSNTEYRLGPGDQLRITVFGENDLTGQYVVGTQGSIAYPLVGEIPAASLTVAEFGDGLRTALEAYIRAPNISVEVANYRPFFILGEVQRPGTYPYSAHLTVQNAVATAGGFTYRANRARVYIRHANEEIERVYALTSNTPVLPGDTVRIGERLF